MAGKHRKNGRAVWVPVPRGIHDIAERRTAAEMTAESGGWVWVMWGQWSRVYFAFGWWGRSVIGREAGELVRAVEEEYAGAHGRS